MTAFNLRSKKLFSLIYQHVEHTNIRHRLVKEANGDGIKAWQTLCAYGEMPTTGLTEIDMDNDWASVRLTSVGIDEQTIINMRGHLDRMNEQRSAKHNDGEICKKILSLITFPPSLRNKALEELQRPSYVKISGSRSSRTTARDLDKTVAAFDELYKREHR